MRHDYWVEVILAILAAICIGMLILALTGCAGTKEVDITVPEDLESLQLSGPFQPACVGLLGACQLTITVHGVDNAINSQGGGNITDSITESETLTIPQAKGGLGGALPLVP